MTCASVCSLTCEIGGSLLTTEGIASAVACYEEHQKLMWLLEEEVTLGVNTQALSNGWGQAQGYRRADE